MQLRNGRANFAARFLRARVVAEFMRGCTGKPIMSERKDFEREGCRGIKQRLVWKSRGRIDIGGYPKSWDRPKTKDT